MTLCVCSSWNVFLTCIFFCANDLSFMDCVHTFTIIYTTNICTNSTQTFMFISLVVSISNVDMSHIPISNGKCSIFTLSSQVFQFPYAIKNWSKCVEASLTPPQAWHFLLLGKSCDEYGRMGAGDKKKP